MKTQSLPVQRQHVVVEKDSPWFHGHFPNNPILPGVAQLQMVIDLLTRQGHAKLRVGGLSRVKFRRLVRPGEVLEVSVAAGDNENRHNFTITCGDENVCSGKVLITPTEHVTTT